MSILCLIVIVVGLHRGGSWPTYQTEIPNWEKVRPCSLLPSHIYTIQLRPPVRLGLSLGSRCARLAASIEGPMRFRCQHNAPAPSLRCPAAAGRETRVLVLCGDAIAPRVIVASM